MAYDSIFFGTIDTAAVEAEIVTQYTLLTGTTPNPSDPEYAMNATIAYARVLSLQAIERAGKANLVKYATGANLDYIGDLIGLKRLDAQPSVVNILFTLITGHAQVVIPGGTLVSSADGKAVFSTNEDVTVAVGVNTVEIDCTCTIEGAFSNGYAIGTIQTIQNPQPYLTSAVSLSVTSGGAEVETDEGFRSRWDLALEAISVAGPKGKYEFYAKSADSTIISAKALGPDDVILPVVTSGTVELRILTETGAPSQPLLNLVYDTCDANVVRPMCDTLIVKAAQEITYDLKIGVIKFIGASVTDNQVKNAILAYTTAQSKEIGNDVVADAIIESGMLPGVKRLDLNGFTDIAVDLRSFTTCNSVTVTITGTEAP